MRAFRLVVMVVTGTIILLGTTATVSAKEKLSKATVEKTTGIKWSSVKIDKQQGVVRELSRSHPLRPQLARPQAATSGDANQPEPRKLAGGDQKAIGKREAEDIALKLLVGSKDVLGFSSPTKVDAAKSSPDVSSIISRDTQEYVVTGVVEHKYSGKQAYMGQDYAVDIQQRHQGIPVFEAKCRILMDQFGTVYKITSSAEPNIVASVTPVISAEQAVAIGMKALSSPKRPAKLPELVIYGREHLAWHINFQDPAFREILVNAITGEILLNRTNVVTSSNVSLTVRDADNAGLQYVTGSYWVPSLGIDVANWTHTTDLNGVCSDAASTAGTNVFCRARLDSTRVEVKDYDNGDDTVFRDTPRFSTVDGQSYTRVTDLAGVVTYDLDEASVCFRETNRAWDYLNLNHTYSHPKVTGHIDSTLRINGNPATFSNGTEMYYWNGDSRVGAGIPSDQAPIADTILHEFAHCIQYHLYGDTWGEPAGTTPNDNHNWVLGNDTNCSHDALVEGWAEFFPVMVYHHTNPNDTGFGASDGSYNVNLEDNSGYGWIGTIEERNEFAFAEALWDIYDNTPNEAGDTLSLGEDEIWTVMRLDRPSTVEDFFQNFVSRYPEYAAGLESIYKSHGMHPDCMKLQTDSDNGETHILDFGADGTQRTLKIKVQDWYGADTGITTGPFADGLHWEIDPDGDLPSWVTVSTSDGDLKSNGEAEVTLTVNRIGMPANATAFVFRIQPSYGRAQTVNGIVHGGGLGIVSVRGRHLALNQWGQVEVDVTVPSDGIYYVRVFNDNLWPFLDWEWDPSSSPARQLTAGASSIFTFAVRADTTSEGFQFWLYKQTAVPGIYWPVDIDNVILFTSTLQEQAIQEGIVWLRSHQAANGSWYNDPAVTSFAVLTMMNWGYNESDPVVSKGITYIRGNINPDGSVYSNIRRSTYYTAIAILPLVATGNSSYEAEIGKMRQWLIDLQWDESSIYGNYSTSHSYYGGWGYGSSGSADLSNTQWALMGLKAADNKLGLSAGSTYNKCADWFLARCRRGDGGSYYTPSGGSSIHTMTAASVWSYALCGRGSGSEALGGLQWLNEHYSLTNNDGWGWWSEYYYKVTLAKALTMTHSSMLGSHNWFEDLSNKLIEEQYPAGNWPDTGMMGSELSTCWAIMALQTRTLLPSGDFGMWVNLESHADVHLYDPSGRHTGVNYGTQTVEENIPGSDFKILDALGNEVPYDGSTPDEGLRQFIDLSHVSAGSYRLELIGTSDGPFRLEVGGTQDGNTVTSHVFEGVISNGVRLATNVTVTSMEGALTLIFEPLAVLPTLDVSPVSVQLDVDPNTVKDFTFTVLECGGSEDLHGVTMYCTDITGPGGSIPGNGATFSIMDFDIAPGGQQTVTCHLPIPVDFVGPATGSIVVQSIDGGSRAIVLAAITNQLPMAVAGPDQTVYAWIDGKADVVLDGADSNDPDGDALTYKWMWMVDSTPYEANGVSPAITLPPGVHTITLVVNDGLVDSLPDDVNVVVVAPITDTTAKLTPVVINRKSRQPYVQAVVVLPAGITRDQIDMTQKLTLYPGGITAMISWMVDYTTPEGQPAVGVRGMFSKPALMAAIPTNGLKYVDVVGRLKSGQWFSGKALMLIMTPPR